MLNFSATSEENGSRLARWPTHAMKLHEWGTRQDFIKNSCGKLQERIALRAMAHLSDDETVAKMGHPAFYLGESWTSRESFGLGEFWAERCS
jgi:hypothetical protein